MKRHDLSPAQVQAIDHAFLEAPPADGTTEKLQKIKDVLRRAARELHQLTPASLEQNEGLRKIREAEFWYVDAVRKYEH